jgi:hypothetical protein
MRSSSEISLSIFKTRVFSEKCFSLVSCKAGELAEKADCGFDKNNIKHTMSK